MMNFSSVTDKNFVRFAERHYDSVYCLEEEFDDDLKRIQHLKRMITKYQNTTKINISLVLNTIMILYNCFGVRSADMLFLKMPQSQHVIKPFLKKLNILPEEMNINGKIINTREILEDPIICLRLKEEIDASCS